MSLILSERIKSIKPSPTIAVTNRAAELKKQGVDIIGLGAGEPDFDTPEFIKQAAIKALQQGQTKYTAVEGTTELRAAISHKFKSENNLEYTANQIVVSCGAKQSIYNLVSVLLQKGDEAIIPTPYWVSYPPMVTLADATPVIVETTKENNFKLTPELLKQSLTPNTKLLFLNSPSNPSGQIYTKTELLALANVLLQYPNVYILSDDIYEHTILNGSKFCNILTACQEELDADNYQNIYNRTIVVNGVSKAYAMTGWRIGYTASSIELAKAMTKLQSQSTSNSCSIAQAATYEALSNPESYKFINHMVNEFKKREEFIYNSINSIPNLSVLKADGAFYSFIDCSEAIKLRGYNNDLDFAEDLLSKAKIALVPGTAFGTPNYLRLSFATSMQNLEKAMDRLNTFLSNP
jgi:aspartate aminotransferase